MKIGDNIYLVQDDKLSYAEIIGFYSHCTYIRVAENNTTVPPYQQGLFYGYSYSGNGIQHLFLCKWWHYYPAKVTERLRLKLPRRISRMLNLQK